MNAIVLAAGEGTKIWPYNETRQKCTLPVGNVPLVRRLVEDLLVLNLRRIAVVVGAHAPSVRHALHGLEAPLLFVEQRERKGTAPAALLALAELGEEEEFLVVYGDLALGQENLQAVVEAFRADQPVAAALVHPLGEERSLDWLCAKVTAGQLTAVEGHPRGGSHRLGGVYAFHPAAVPYLRNNPGLFRHVPVGGMPPLEAEIAQSVAMLLEEGQMVRAVETTEFFVDVDKPWHILEANARLLDYLCARLEGNQIAPDARIHDGAEIEGRVVLGPGSSIGNRVVVRGDLFVGAHAQLTNGAILGGEVLVGDHCRVRDYGLVGSHSVLGPHSLVAHGAEFSGVLFDGVFLYHYCEMAGVYGSRVDIGAASVCGTLRFDDENTLHYIKGRREFPRWGANCAYMGDYSRTGVNAILMPGVKVGAYSCVGPGVVLYEDLPSRKVVLLQQELVFKDWGPEKYGW